MRRVYREDAAGGKSSIRQCLKNPAFAYKNCWSKIYESENYIIWKI